MVLNQTHLFILMDEWCVIEKDGLTVKNVTVNSLPKPQPRPVHKPPPKPKKPVTNPVVQQPK